MPTFTTIAWENLLEPRVRESCKNKPPCSKQQAPKSAAVEEENKGEKRSAPAPRHFYISPALYATPEPTPIPDLAVDPLSPSPYVVNHKRRGGEGFGRRVDGFEEASLRKSPDGERDLDSEGIGYNVAEEVVDDTILGAEVAGGSIEEDDFFNPRCDSARVDSSVYVGDCVKQAESRSYVSNQGEFFDAIEDFSSDSSGSKLNSCGPTIDTELHGAKISPLEEIERRRAAEYAVDQMRNQWQQLVNALSQMGLTFPSPPNSSSMQMEIDSLEQFCQEVIVGRFVAKAIGRGQAQAEAEIAAEAINESKDKEISRLRDRLKYYEAVNREMSQRNQEVMEAARKQRQRRKNRRRWLWGCIGLSVMIGTSAIAYSYLPQLSKPNSLPSPGGPCDASCSGGPSEI